MQTYVYPSVRINTSATKVSKKLLSSRYALLGFTACCDKQSDRMDIAL